MTATFRAQDSAVKSSRRRKGRDITSRSLSARLLTGSRSAKYALRWSDIVVAIRIVTRHLSTAPRLRGSLLVLFLGAAPTVSLCEEPAAFAATLESLAERYEIAIEWSDVEFPVRTQHGLVAGEAASASEIAKYTPLLVLELGLYPPKFVNKTHLQRIVLCREISFAGQRRSAIPDFEHDTLYLDVARASSKLFYLNKVFHHEFFHIVDLRDDGRLYNDDRWQQLNRSEFSYGAGGKNAQSLTDTSVLTDRYPGFLNHYSTTGVEEDKAELFANLIVESKYVEERMAADAVLNAKVARLKDELHAFCDDLDENFWKRVSQARRSPVK